MSVQSTDPADQTRARVDRLLRDITELLTDGAQLQAIREAADAVARAAATRSAVAVLAESVGGHRVISHHIWDPLLGDGTAGITPARSTIGYVSAVRLKAVDTDRPTIRDATVSFMDRSHVASCQARMLEQLSDEPGTTFADRDWRTALDSARAMWPSADRARQACLTELVALYRAQIFAERFLGREGVPVRLEAIHQATMPVQRSADTAGQPPFPHPGGAGPYDRAQDLTQGVLHRVFPVIRRVEVDVDVPRSLWPLGEGGLDLIDLPMLDAELRTGRAEWLIETELATAGAVVTVEGPQREVEKFLVQLRTPAPTVVLPAPDNYVVASGQSSLADLRADICDRGRDACLAARAAHTETAYEAFRQAVRGVVSALDEAPITAPPPPSPGEMRIRDLLGRMSAMLSAMSDDVERGVAGPEAHLADGIRPNAALRQWVTTQVHGWPQWPALLAALRHQVLVPSAGHEDDELPTRPEVLETRFRTVVREIPEACVRVIDAAVEAWLRRWSHRLAPLKVEFLDVVQRRGDQLAQANETVAKLRRGVQLGWLAEIRPAAPPALEPSAIRDAFPLDPRRPLPWHGAVEGKGGHGHHLMTVMRLRRELVVAAHRLAEEQLADEFARRVGALRQALRGQQDVQQRADMHVRVLIGAHHAAEPVPPQVLARQFEKLLEAENLRDRSHEDAR